jgi:hypothetical protein
MAISKWQLAKPEARKTSNQQSAFSQSEIQRDSRAKKQEKGPSTAF